MSGTLRPGGAYAGPLSLRAQGSRVRVATVEPQDVPPYRMAVEASRDRLKHWNPVNPEDLEYHLSRQSSDHRTFLIHALESAFDPAAGHGIVGKVNVTNVVRGRAMSGVLGYDAYDPYAGAGLFAEGLRLTVDLALAPYPDGMGLHRVEAGVQPGNERSAGVLRSLGFRPRGFWPAYLLLPDDSGVDAWRDHVIYGVTREEWPAEPYGRATPRPAYAVVIGGGTTAEIAGRDLAADLGVPLLRADLFAAAGRAGLDALIGVLRDCATGAVLATGDAEPDVLKLLTGAGIQVQDVAAVSSDDLPDAGAVARFAVSVRALAGSRVTG